MLATLDCTNTVPMIARAMQSRGTFSDFRTHDPNEEQTRGHWRLGASLHRALRDQGQPLRGASMLPSCMRVKTSAHWDVHAWANRAPLPHRCERALPFKQMALHAATPSVLSAHPLGAPTPGTLSVRRHTPGTCSRLGTPGAVGQSGRVRSRYRPFEKAKTRAEVDTGE